MKLVHLPSPTFTNIEIEARRARLWAQTSKRANEAHHILSNKAQKPMISFSQPKLDLSPLGASAFLERPSLPLLSLTSRVSMAGW